MTEDIHEKLRSPFPKEAISWRAQSVTKSGDKAMALAYIDSRDVRRRLNEVVGPANWQCEHYDCGEGKLGCRLSIRINGEWVFKTDGAGDTDIEAEKGAFSSALKRAAVAWGVGEYLYEIKSPWVPCKSYESGGKMKFSEFTDDPWKYVKEEKTEQAKSFSGTEMKSLIDGIKSCRTLEDLQVEKDKARSAWHRLDKTQRETITAEIKKYEVSLVDSPIGKRKQAADIIAEAAE